MERNSGYTERLDGTSVSVNAEYAESVGKFPKMLFIKNNILPTKMLEKLRKRKCVSCRIMVK